MVEQRQIERLAERHHAQVALRIEHHAAIRPAAAGHPEGVAENPRGAVPDGELALGEADLPRRLGKGRQRRVDLEPVVGKLVFAPHPRIGQLAQRQNQMQIETAGALDPEGIGEMVDALAHRAVGDETQEILGRAVGGAVNVEHAVGFEIRQYDGHVLQFGTEDATAPGLHRHAGGFEKQFAGHAFDLRPARGVVELSILDPRGDPESAVLRVAEGELRQFALEHQPRIHRAAAGQTVLQPVAGVLADHARHVAPHGAAVGIRETRLQVDLAGRIGARPVAPGRRAASVPVGESGAGERDFELAARMAPGALGGQFGKAQPRLGEDLRQFEGGVLARQAEATALVVALDAAGQTRKPRPGAHRRDAQAGKAGIHRIAGQRVAIGAPLDAERRHRARRRKGRQTLANGRREGQPPGQPREHVEIELIGDELALGRRRAALILKTQEKVGGSQLQAVGGPKAEALAAGLGDAAFVAVAQPAFGVGQRNVGQILGQPHVGVAHREIGRHAADPPLGEFEPGAQAAGTVGIERVIDPLAPGAKVGVVEAGVNLASPLARLCRIAAPQIAPHVEGRRKARRRLGHQPETVACAAVFEAEFEFVEHQFVGPAQRVAPLQAGVADHDLALVEQPLGEVAAPAIGFHRQTGDGNLPVGLTADRQIRRIDLQAPQAQAEQQQRTPGRFGFDVTERQGRLARRILDGQAADPEARTQARPLGGQTGDFHRQTDRPGQHLLQFAPIGRHIGQHAVTQAEEGQPTDEIDDQRQHGQAAQADAGQVQEEGEAVLSHAADGPRPRWTGNRTAARAAARNPARDSGHRHPTGAGPADRARRIRHQA